jgi:hypothetical protein
MEGGGRQPPRQLGRHVSGAAAELQPPSAQVVAASPESSRM